MRSALKIPLLLLISLTVEAQVFTVETVPNTKLVNNSYVSDPTHILNDTTVARINQLLDSLEAKATAQVAVVMLPSIGEADRFEFAQRLFEHWRIGQAEKDNGLLILFILDQRNIRFHTGFGLEGLLSDARCKQIQQQFMVPSFKEGDYNKGMLLGIEKVATLLTTPEAVDEIFVEEKSLEDKYLLIGFGVAYGLYVLIAF
ncbi:MAG TPA: TPM domain-containing protein, partial [Cyclobacteriaceae bacterium]|nr:TPM domain-containing protein [Cyclobacteriaceae bacterium]